MREVDDAGAERGVELVGAVALAVERDHERLVLGVDQVVGAGCTDLAHLGRSRRAREGDSLRASVDLEDHAVRVGEESAAEHRQRGGENGVRLPLPELRGLRAAQAEAACAAGVQRGGGPAHEIDRGAVALLRGVAPGDQAVLLEQHGARGRVLVEQLGDALRHREARPLVIEPDRLVAEDLLGRGATGARQRDHRVGMRVVDTRRRDEGVQQRLDRRPRLARRKRAVDG